MHHHSHHDCHEDHTLKFCKKCNAVYCDNCHKEWRENWWTYTYYPNTYTIPAYKPFVPYCDTTTGGLTVSTTANISVPCSHNA